MKVLAAARSWSRALLRRTRFEGDMDTELRAHIEAYTEDLVRDGMPPEEALRRARIQFGGVERIKEECRESRGVHFVESLMQDLRFATRMLRKSPGFTAVAVLTLTLGIGANSAIFSAVYGVLLRPLPYKDPSHLIVLNETTPRVGMVSVSYPNFLDWRAQSHAFSQFAVAYSVGFNLAGAGISQPENISGEAVSTNFLSMLGVHPFLGRDFEPSEEKPGTAPVVLLSYELWQSHLGADRNAVGRTISLDGHSYTIIGVLPAGFRSLDKTDVLEPIGVFATSNSDTADRGSRGDMSVVARLAPGTTLAQARAEMEGIAARLAKQYPASNDQFGVALRPIRDVFVGDIRTPLLVLLGAVLFVLLIACANVANLFLVRGAGRNKEFALRVAFGASRGRIIRQMLTESFALAFVGGVLGVLLALAGIRWISGMIMPEMLNGAQITLNGAVLLFTAGVVLLAAFVFGLAPALHSSKQDVQTELKEGSRTSTAGGAQNRLRRALAIAEISLSLVLLVAAGLMMKSLYHLLSVDPGVRTDHVLTMAMNLRTQQYSKPPTVRTFWQQVLERVSALPGVESAAIGTAVPFTGDHSRGDITIEGMPLPRPGSWPHPDFHVVSPGYLSTLGIPLLRGRDFTSADNENAPPVGIINSKLAQQFFPGQDPIGKRFMFGHPDTDPPKWITIVGVVGDTKLYGLANPARLEIYISARRSAMGNMELLVKSKIDPAALISSIRAVVSSIDKDQPIFAVSTLNALRDSSIFGRRITLILLGVFSGLALVLATIGIYGVVSYAVAQRTHEIGIRMALGAQHRDVLRTVLGQGGKIALIGTAIGLAMALGLTRFMSSLLFSVSASDPLTFAGVAGLLLVVAMLACYIPARRAMKVDPMVALRYE